MVNVNTATDGVDVRIQFGRFTLVKGSPPASPGKCVMCGSVHGEFIDFGFDLDFYGVVYFCRECFGEAVDVFTSETLFKLRETTKVQQIKIAELEAENKELRDALGVIDRARTVYIDDNQLELPFAENASEDVGDESEDKPGDDRASEGRQPEVSESDDEQGHSDVRNDDELTKLLKGI